ncbi:hypothetical protein AVEN_53775-1, partial [Araneus ventricosus]
MSVEHSRSDASELETKKVILQFEVMGRTSEAPIQVLNDSPQRLLRLLTYTGMEKKSEQLNPKNLVGKAKYGGGGVLVWGCMSASGI